MVGFAQAISVHGKVVRLINTNLLRFAMSRYTRDNGQASSWFYRGWAPSTKHQTKNTYSGWSKRATRGYQSDYDYDDRSREWEESTPSGSTKTREVEPETWAAAEVEIVDERDKNQGKTGTNNAAGSATANTTLDSAGDTATEKDAFRRRLEELHRLLNSRKGSLSATFKKNAEANDRAYDLDQKTIQALDALAVEYAAFETTMTKCYKRARGRRCITRSGLGGG